MTDDVPLALLARELRDLTGGEVPGYRALLGLALDGKLPAERIRGRWYVPRRALPEVARHLGLTAGRTAA